MRRTCARVKLLSVVASCTALHRLSVRAAGLLPVRVSHTLPCVVASCTALHRLGVRAAGVFCAPTTTPVSAGSLFVCQSRVLSKSGSRAGKSRVTCRSRLIISRLSSLCVYAFTTSPLRYAHLWELQWERAGSYLPVTGGSFPAPWSAGSTKSWRRTSTFVIAPHP